MADLQTHRRRYLMLLLLICPIAAFVLMPRPPDFSVGKKARKLVSTTDWFESPLAGGLAYQWQSQDRIVVMHMHGKVTLVDIRTGGEQSLTRMDDAFKRHPGLAPLSSTIPNWVLSPDGAWILTYTLVSGQAEWVAARLDGSRIVEAPTPTLVDPMAFWERGGRGFVQLSFSQGGLYARTFSLNGPNPAPIPMGSDPRDVRIDLPRFQLVNPYMPLGEFAPGYLMMGNFGDRSGSRFMIVDLRPSDVKRADSVSRTAYTRPVPADVALPAGAVVSEIELSPDGKRIGWVLDFAIGSVDPSLRNLPFIPIAPRHGNNEVWVSNRDGSRMHPVVTPGKELNHIGPTNLRWTPDSKAVTFVYSGALYSAPAG